MTLVNALGKLVLRGVGTLVGLSFLSQSAQAVNILSHWTFDESGGAFAVDNVGGHNGTLQGNAAFVGGGISGNAISLNQATNDLVNMGDIYAFTSGNFSVSAWVNSTVLNDNFVVGRQAAGYLNGYNLAVNGFNPSQRRVTKAGFYTSSAPGQEVLGNTTVTDGNWHQLVAVYEQGGNSLLYVDGVLDAFNASEPINGATVPNSDPFLVGGDAFNSQPTGLYTGLIDDVQVYGGALSTNNVQFLYQHPGSTLPVSVSVPWELDGLPVIGTTIIFGFALWGKQKLNKKKIQ